MSPYIFLLIPFFLCSYVTHTLDTCLFVTYVYNANALGKERVVP